LNRLGCTPRHFHRRIGEGHVDFVHGCELGHVAAELLDAANVESLAREPFGGQR